MGCCQSIESDDDSISSPKPASPPSRNRTVRDIYEHLAETEEIDTHSARNIVHLFENQNTIPFICRYRRDLIDSKITPDRLRQIKNAYTEIVGLRQRGETVISQLGDINDETRAQILGARTMKEQEYLHSIYKCNSKDGRAQGFEDIAYRLLIGESPQVQLQMIVDRRNVDLNSITKVKDIICGIISDRFSKDNGIRDQLRRLQKTQKLILKCSKIEVSNDSASSSSHGNRKDESLKYEKYFNWEDDVRNLKSHQVLAINRGERSKFLTVQVILPDNFKNNIRTYIHTSNMSGGLQYALRNEIFQNAFNKCYTEKLMPFVCRQVREDLTVTAEKAALDVFAKNLKQLLLTPPLKGERILGIDPGFRDGCKLALISETANVLQVAVVYPHTRRNNSDKFGITLAQMLAKHRCKIIALGNGTACRQTESWLTGLFEKRILNPENVHYVIVSEQGASVYSCSAVAKQEFPKLDVKLISAVSIARRLNDPLSEYVKIEPRHLGVGMYQHDISNKLLSRTLYEVVSECVSYVGVDINTASSTLLKHVAGLDENRAQDIIQHRQKYGPFRTRRDLLRVTTVGEETFLQCAGFIRIEPKSLGGKLDNMLDCTWVHPESYAVATHIIARCKLDLNDIGKPEFISKIKFFAEANLIETLAKHFATPSARLRIVLEGLQRQLCQDYRPDFDKKLFKKDIRRMEDLFIGETLTGQVKNIVPFGAFVDIGLEKDGLIHKSKMQRMQLSIGNKVNVSVLSIDKARKQIELRLDGLI